MSQCRAALDGGGIQQQFDLLVETQVAEFVAQDPRRHHGQDPIGREVCAATDGTLPLDRSRAGLVGFGKNHDQVPASVTYGRGYFRRDSLERGCTSASTIVTQ